MASAKQIQNFTRTLRAPGFVTRGEGKFGVGVRVINKTGSTIAADKLVYINGYDSTSKLPTIALADADAAGKYGKVYVTAAQVVDGKYLDVYEGGLSAATLDTSSANAVGDPVYLSTTAGGFTFTAPSASNSVVLVVGFCKVKSASVGQILWNIQRVPQKFGTNDFQSSAITATDGVTLDVLGAGSTAEIAKNVLRVATGTISSANITGTSAGQLGHANGVVLVPAASAGSVNILVSALVSLHFSTAAYTGGGNTTINISGGGAAVTGLVANSGLVTASGNKIVNFVPLAGTINTYTDANGLALVSASAPTQPGTAAGTITWQVVYQTITW